MSREKLIAAYEQRAQQFTDRQFRKLLARKKRNREVLLWLGVMAMVLTAMGLAYILS